jgi:glycosyltransferase involved in cell wall biosynthesis
MKIGIDISQIAFPGTGSAVYTENLVKNLLKEKENQYVLFFSSLRQSAPKDFKSKNFKFPPLLLEQIWNRFHVLPIEKLIGKVDVFHTSDWLEPPSHCPKVTTIHDLIIFKYPERFKRRGGHDIVVNLQRKLKWVKKESTLIIAVSESTKQDIVDILKIPTKKIRVIYEAPKEIFQKKVSETKIEQVKRKYKINGDYLLMVGTREPRKNLERAIEAFKLVIRKSPVTAHR